MTVWHLIAALAATPSAAIIVRGLVRRLDGRARSVSEEIDYLRSELVRERAECDEERREYEERIAAQTKAYGKLTVEKAALDARIFELKQQLAQTERERDQANTVAAWMAAQKGSGE